MSKLVPVRIPSDIPSVNADLLAFDLRVEYRFDGMKFTNAKISLSVAAAINDSNVCMLVVACHQISTWTSLSETVIVVFRLLGVLTVELSLSAGTAGTE